MKSSFKETIQFVGLDYRKQIVLIVLANIALLVCLLPLIYFKVNIYIFVVYGLGFIVMDYLLISRYGDMKRKLIRSRDGEFIEMLSYFEIFISNNRNVYQAFNSIIPFCSEWLKENIEKFLVEVDNDKTVQPYVNFARSFSLLVIESVMISIYQMVDEGEGSTRINEFNTLYSQISASHTQEIIETKERRMDIVNSFPLIGAALITVALTFAIVSVVGDMINVV